MGRTDIITINPGASLRDIAGSTIERHRERAPMVVYVDSPTATSLYREEVIDTMLMRIPGRSAARGEVTHKTISQMNRKERRAFQSNSKRK